MNRHPHSSHSSKHYQLVPGNLLTVDSPSHRLHPESDHVQHLLEELDDVIFLAIKGDTRAMHQAQVLWPQVVHQVGWELVEESREQYLRYANDICRQLDRDKVNGPECSIAALDVIELLTCDQ